MADDKGPAYTVTGQQQDFGEGPNGTYVQGVRITYRTAAGSTGALFVPQTEYTVDNVRRLLDKAAETAVGIERLGG